MFEDEYDDEDDGEPGQLDPDEVMAHVKEQWKQKLGRNGPIPRPVLQMALAKIHEVGFVETGVYDEDGLAELWVEIDPTASPFPTWLPVAGRSHLRPINPMKVVSLRAAHARANRLQPRSYSRRPARVSALSPGDPASRPPRRADYLVRPRPAFSHRTRRAA